MLKNVRVLYKILVSFLIVFLLSIFALIYNVIVINNLATTLNDFYNQSYIVSNLSKDILIDLNQIHEYLDEISEDPDKISTKEKQKLIGQLEKQIFYDFEVIDSNFPDDSTKAMPLKEAITNSKKNHDDLLNYILEENYKQAAELKEINRINEISSI